MSRSRAELPQRAALYTRVSTEMQSDRDSLPMQRKDLAAYSELVLGIGDHVLFEDAGFSAKNTDRPAYQEMMRRIRNLEFSHLLVWKIDRISRNLLDFTVMYQELQDLGVTFVSKNEQFDTSTAIGGAMLKIILVFAELERKMAAERVTATMISRAVAGEWNGGRVAYGYDHDPETDTFTINPEEERACRCMLDAYLRTGSLRLTAEALNSAGFARRDGTPWTYSSVSAVLSGEFQCGTYVYNRHLPSSALKPESDWVRVPGHHPAVFSEEEHRAVLEVRASGSSRRNCPRGKGAPQIFRGLVYCDVCGVPLLGDSATRAGGRRAMYYICRRRRANNSCTGKSVREDTLGDFVLNYMLNMFAVRDRFAEIENLEDMEKIMLRGITFRGVSHVRREGLEQFRAILEAGPEQDAFFRPVEAPQSAGAMESRINTLLEEKARQERAMGRLEGLYLYSETAMSEQEFISRREAIAGKIRDVQAEIDAARSAQEEGRFLTDEQFMEVAGRLLLSEWIAEKPYIYFPNLLENVPAETLIDFFNTTLDRVYVSGGRVVKIIFKNGMTHEFEWE